MQATAAAAPHWETELRTLVRRKIKEQVTMNVRDPAYLSMWTRRPHNFVDSEADKLTDDCWELLRVWHPLYDATHMESRLASTWHQKSKVEQSAIAQEFKLFFYEKRGYYQKK